MEIKNLDKDSRIMQDYAICRAVKYILQHLEQTKKISFKEYYTIHIYIDEQPVATNGKYNLKDSIDTELFIGKYNSFDGSFREPIFKMRGKTKLLYRDSKHDVLLRASDIVANRIFVFTHQEKNDGFYFPIINLP